MLMPTKEEENKEHRDDLPQELSILTFCLDEQRYAIPVHDVAQIIEMVTITHVPHMPTAVQGVINVHGQMVPVLDLRCRFNLPAKPYHLYTPIILVTSQNQLMGLIVDEVQAVLTLSGAELEKPENMRLAELIDLLAESPTESIEELLPLPTAFLLAIVKVAPQAILLLNLAAVLTRQEKKAVDQALVSLINAYQ
jgi:purine-binding chemotaxis protein CheW